MHFGYFFTSFKREIWWNWFYERLDTSDICAIDSLWMFMVILTKVKIELVLTLDMWIVILNLVDSKLIEIAWMELYDLKLWECVKDICCGCESNRMKWELMLLIMCGNLFTHPNLHSWYIEENWDLCHWHHLVFLGWFFF